jgi:phosphoglycerol transferase MdoB-like AlkP superfamily enzyme
MVAALTVFAVGAYWTAFPANSANRNSFLHSLVLPLRHPLFLCSLAALSLLAWAVARRATLAFVASFAIAALAIVLPLGGMTASASVSFACRTLTLTLLPALLLVAAFTYLRGFRLERGTLLVTMTVMSLLGIANAVSWRGWIEFREEFRGILRVPSGYVAVEDTALFRNSYRWNWTSPLLSILWSEGCVRTIVLSPTRVRWEPFDPRTSLPMQRYVRFAMPLASSTPAAPTCR